MSDSELDTSPLPEPEPRAPASRAGRNLPIAIVSGVLLAALFLGALAWHDLAALVFVGVVLAVGLLELGVGLRDRGLRPLTLLAVASSLVMFVGAYVIGPIAHSVALTLLVFGAFGWIVIDPDRGDVVGKLGSTFLMTLWVGFFGSFLSLLLAAENGRWLVAATIGLTVTGDIGAYGWGRAFGRHKLAPQVSPAKTWEGLLGALVTVLLLAGLVTAQLVDGLGVAQALALGAGVTCAGMLGDLSESAVKRSLQIKDLGSVLPGHGGVMDRIDGMLLAQPIAYLILLATGVV